MSSLESVTHESGLASRVERVRAYLRRFFTSWVAEDPEPEYSKLDRADGLDLVPDPVCTPRLRVPESPEVAAQGYGDEDDDIAASAGSARIMAGGRAGR